MDFIKNLSRNKLIAIAAGTIFTMIATIALLYNASNSSMVALYNNLTPEDSYPITLRLQAMGVPYEAKGNGAEIMVPLDRALSLRMTLAQEGLPAARPQSGYEIFDKSDLLGSSQFMNSVNLTRAMEGEISRTISSLAPIEYSRVHIVMPKRDLFSKSGPVPSASVMVKIRPGYQLKKKDINGIAHLLATAVPDLVVKNITIVDQSGKSLRIDDEEEEKGDLSKEMLDYRRNIENKIQANIEELLVKYVGEGKVKATVSANINFNKEMVNIEDFNPDRQVVRSKKSSNEDDSERDPRANVSVANNIPNFNQNVNGDDNTKKRSRSDEIVNFEISRTLTNKVLQWGNINNISVAVLVDGIYEKDAQSGETKYRDRNEEEMRKLRSLVASAAGIDAGRGDTFEVINLPFEQKIDVDGDDSVKSAEDNRALVRLILIVFSLLILAFVGLRPWLLRFVRGKFIKREADRTEDNDISWQGNNDPIVNEIMNNQKNDMAVGNKNDESKDINSASTSTTPPAPSRFGGGRRLQDMVTYLNQSVKSNPKNTVDAIMWLLSSGGEKEKR